jgi:HK97 family phage major capsid protein
MSAEQKERYEELLAKDEEKLNAAERSELAHLKEVAEEAGFDPKDKSEELEATEATETTEDEGKSLSEDQVSGLVQKALSDQLQKSGLTADSLVEKVKDASKDGVLTEEQVTKIVSENTQHIDTDSIVEKVKATMPAAVTEERIQEIITKSFEDHRKESKMQHNVEIPVGPRGGNLTVAQKQLLNCCLMKSGSVPDSKKPKHMNDGIPDSILERAEQKGAQMVAKCRDASMQKVLVGGAGTGAELVDTDLSSDLQRRLYLESALANQLVSREVDMPTETYKLPLTTDRPSFFTTTESTAAISSDVGTANVILVAKKLTGEVPFSYEADEDMIVPILPMIQQGLGSGAAAALEDAIINGDDTATHQDTDTHAVTRHAAKLFKGLRKLSLGVSGCSTDMSTGGLVLSELQGIKKKAKKYGMRPQDCAWIVGTDTYNDLLLLDQTITVDKLGPAATILSGELASLFGIPIIPSEFCREDLNTSGVDDGVTATKRALQLVYMPGLILGVRRGFTVEVDREPRSQMNYVVASFRRDLQPIETNSATAPFIQIGYNF